MENTKEKLRKLEFILKEKNAPILKYFNPGLSRLEIVAFFERNGIKTNESLIALYEWHNGIDFVNAHVLQPVIELLPMGVFYTTDYMIKTKEDLISWHYLELGDISEYLPLFGSGEDDIYLLKQTTGEIFYIAPAIQILGSLEYKSIDSMLDNVIECYEEGIFIIDSETGLDVKYEEWAESQMKYK